MVSLTLEGEQSADEEAVPVDRSNSINVEINPNPLQKMKTINVKRASKTPNKNVSRN